MSPRITITFALISTILVILVPTDTIAALKRCYMCRSRGELGDCKDPFTWNVTQIEHEKGIQTIPCASGWCGKIVETENALKEEYGVATQRICLQRGPSDSEDRCAYTKWQHKKVLMCFCRGDLCNNSNLATPSNNLLMYIAIPIITITYKYLLT